MALIGRLAVPANLLLFGEYAILEEDGKGIACATTPYLITEISPADELIIEGRTATETLAYQPLTTHTTHTNQKTFLAQVCDAILETLEISTSDNVPGVRIIVDSHSFFDDDGSKLGLGSSAALTVAITSALMVFYGGLSLADRDAILPVAISAHRTAQGGRGSGYDVAASLYGGWGNFIGGLRPVWHACQLPWMPPLYLWSNKTSVATPQAIQHYRLWRHRNSVAHQKYMQKTDRFITQLLNVANWSEALPIAQELTVVSAELGQKIGIPATIPATLKTILSSLETESHLCKALGSGDELFLVASPSGVADGTPVQIASRGLHWLS